MYYFCALISQQSLSKVLASYHSLIQNMPNQFRFYGIVADVSVVDILQDLNLQQLTITPWSDIAHFLNQSGMAVDATASGLQDFFLPQIMQWVLQHHQLPQCVYLDASCYFFQSPVALLESYASYDMVLTPCAYSKPYLPLVSRGSLTIQFLVFKNNHNVMHILNWWAKQIQRIAPMSNLDSVRLHQEVLEDVCKRFNGVTVLEHGGAGAAPWNIQSTCLDNVTAEITLRIKSKHYPLIFYYFYGVRRGSKIGQFDLGGFILESWVVDIIYQPYLRHLIAIERLLTQRFPAYRYSCDWTTLSWKEWVREALRHLLYDHHNRLELCSRYPDPTL